MSTSVDGFGATRPPPITYILPPKLRARVSPVARGMAAIVPRVLVAGLKLNELVVSITVPPEKSDAPPTYMIPFIVVVGAYMIPSGVFTICVHLEPAAAFGSNCQIWFVEATLILKPPRMYSLLLATANPPGRIVPAESPGQLSVARVVA